MKKIQFRFDNKSVIVVAEKVEDEEIKYKFICFVDGEESYDYEQDVNGLDKAMEEAKEHFKTCIRMDK